MTKGIKGRTLAGAILAALIFITAAIPAFAGVNVPVTVDIPITYIVSGNDRVAGGDTFILTPDDPEAPMPEGTADGVKTITIKREGTYSFGEIYYDRPNVWWYTITRDVTKKKGVTKDDSVYRAKVIALNDGHGYVLVYLEGSDEKHELVYKDKVAPATGESNRILVYAGMFSMTALALALFAAAGKRKKKNKDKDE